MGNLQNLIITAPDFSLEPTSTISIHRDHLYQPNSRTTGCLPAYYYATVMAMFSQNPVLNGPNYSFAEVPKDAVDGLREHRFNPYTDNGGSTLAIAGADFAIMAGDTRLTSGYSINTRYSPKVFKIGGSTSAQDDANILLSVVGFAADGEALKERLDAICKMYRYRHGKPMSVNACAKRLSTIMYQKRFFPYYVYAILGGLDEEGKGAVYSYDPVGSYEREQCRAGGAAGSLIMPFLDNQVNFKNQYVPGSGTGHDLQERERVPLPRNEVEILVKDAFDSAVERHIEVGDALQMMVITKDGIEEKTLPLKKD
ncbi:N-terminal nucleophile aminohydrolase [Hypoxylon sp. FL1150]|nr:N-terminal nucleophile aminohydrolase [Hypoxylon sp. FL1150]